MSNSPVVYSSEQQLQLQELEKQINGFNSFKAAVGRGLFSGQDSILAANLIGFLDNLSSQSMKQVKQIQDDAKAKSEQPLASAQG